MPKSIKLSKSYVIENTIIPAYSQIHIISIKEKVEQRLKECIIVTSKCKDNHVFLAKNRDRAYYGRLELIKDMVDNTERAYFVDAETGYSEGLSYNHKTGETIGILNTALSVKEDEKEKELATTKSIEGQKILDLLSLANFEEIIKKFNDDHWITGHTFIVSISKDSKIKGQKFEVIKLDKEDDSTVKIEEDGINFDLVSVRTNHADLLNLAIEDKTNDMMRAGYEVGDSYVSSKVRKNQVEANLVDEEIRLNMTVKDIMNMMKKKKYEYDSPLNMQRDCFQIGDEENNIGLRTIGQVGIDLTSKTLYYDDLNYKSNVLYVINKVPKDIKSALTIKVLTKRDDIEVIEYNS